MAVVRYSEESFDVAFYSAPLTLADIRLTSDVPRYCGEMVAVFGDE